MCVINIPHGANHQCKPILNICCRVPRTNQTTVATVIGFVITQTKCISNRCRPNEKRLSVYTWSGWIVGGGAGFNSVCSLALCLYMIFLSLVPEIDDNTSSAKITHWYLIIQTKRTAPMLSERSLLALPQFLSYRTQCWARRGKFAVQNTRRSVAKNRHWIRLVVRDAISYFFYVVSGCGVIWREENCVFN